MTQSCMVTNFMHSVEGGGIGPADPASARPKFRNHNPQLLFMSSECICIGTS